MFASAPFLLVLGWSCPSSICPCSMCVHAKAKTRSQQTSNRRKRGREHMKRHKADKHDRHGKQRNKKASKQAKRKTSKKANKRWCPQGTNVGLDRMSIASLCWSMDDTLAIKTHAWICKQACKHKKPMGDTNKHGKHIIARSGKGKRYARSNRHHDDASQMVTSKQGLIGVGRNHTTTNLLRVLSAAKSRTREANASIKHRNKQA